MRRLKRKRRKMRARYVETDAAEIQSGVLPVQDASSVAVTVFIHSNL